MKNPFHPSDPDRPSFRIPRPWTCRVFWSSPPAAAMVFALFAAFPPPAPASVKIGLKSVFYAGIGIGRTLDARHPALAIEDQDDLDYEAINLAGLERYFKRGQIRLNLLHVGDFSFGYAFWGHALEYPHEFFYFLPKEQKPYPFGTHAALHAATVQWNLKFVSGKKIVPFLLAGAGRFYGNSTTMRFQLLDSEQSIYQYFIQQDFTDEGNAWLAGAGAVLFKYGYIYAGIVRLERTLLPSKGFLDLIAGFTI
jgi:hypothetical protein